MFMTSHKTDIATSMMKMHLQHAISNNVDFSRCHKMWSTHSLDLRPVSSDNLGKYYAIAIPAITMNIAVLCFGLFYIWKQRYIQGMLKLLGVCFSAFVLTVEMPTKTGGPLKLSSQLFAKCSELDLYYHRS